MNINFIGRFQASSVYPFAQSRLGDEDEYGAMVE
jgi:hypothetical protein